MTVKLTPHQIHHNLAKQKTLSSAVFGYSLLILITSTSNAVFLELLFMMRISLIKKVLMLVCGLIQFLLMCHQLHHRQLIILQFQHGLKMGQSYSALTQTLSSHDINLIKFVIIFTYLIILRVEFV